jgi:hypothetical protein
MISWFMPPNHETVSSYAMHYNGTYATALGSNIIRVSRFAETSRKFRRLRVRLRRRRMRRRKMRRRRTRTRTRTRRRTASQVATRIRRRALMADLLRTETLPMAKTQTIMPLGRRMRTQTASTWRPEIPVKQVWRSRLILFR